MLAPQAEQLTYHAAMDWSRAHALRLAEVPVEHAVSIPLPTTRLGRQAYLQTGSPALRRPGEPVRQEPPDRWWMFEARGGRLAAYALTSAIPLQAAGPLTSCDLVSPAGSVAALREGREAFAAAMDAAVLAFFAGAPPSPGEGARVTSLLEAITPPALLAQYRALAPDFFAWLQG